MRISVAICTYNGEEFIAAQLASILAQTEQVDEIIIYDDASSDKTILIIEEMMVTSSIYIKLLKNSHNVGSIRSFEKCIKECSGDIIFLSDQDDLWKYDKVRKLTGILSTDEKALAVFSDGELIDSDGKLLSSTLREKWGFDSMLRNKWEDSNFIFSELLYNRNVITGATLAFKKELLKLLIPFEIPAGYWHDSFIGIIASGLDGLRFVNESTIFYRIHKKQQVGLNSGPKDSKFDGISRELYFEKLVKLFPAKRKLIYPPVSIWMRVKKIVKFFFREINKHL